jgi:transposase InsO family protein
VSTIHRVLERNRLVAARPPRRARARKRFERELANDLWQIDGTRLALAAGEPAWIIDCLDDHARFLLAAIACPQPSGQAAWACFVAASSAYGLPRQLLSDNHVSFTGRLHGVTVEFERKLAEAGVELINAAPAHPQTLGKLERFHRTLEEWLADEGPAADLEHLQLLLDRFRSHYNGERPHQGIGDATPAERYLPGPALAAPLGELGLAEQEKAPSYPPHSVVRKVSRVGTFSYQGLGIILPVRYAGARVHVLEIGKLIHVYLDQKLIRVLAPDWTKRYQTLNRQKRRKR